MGIQDKQYAEGAKLGFARGGVVKKNMGGSVGLGQMGGMGDAREITVDDVTITTPRAKGGRVGLHKSASRRAVGTTRSATGGSVHDKLIRHGGKMGFKHGGAVKQPTMDTGVQPARRGRNQAEIEAGGTKRMLPGLKKGGRVKKKGSADTAQLQAAMASSLLTKISELKGTQSDYEVQHMKTLNASIGKSSASNVKVLSKMRAILQHAGGKPEGKPAGKSRGKSSGTSGAYMTGGLATHVAKARGGSVKK